MADIQRMWQDMQQQQRQQRHQHQQQQQQAAVSATQPQQHTASMRATPDGSCSAGESSSSSRGCSVHSISNCTSPVPLDGCNPHRALTTPGEVVSRSGNDSGQGSSNIRQCRPASRVVSAPAPEHVITGAHRQQLQQQRSNAGATLAARRHTASPTHSSAAAEVHPVRPATTAIVAANGSTEAAIAAPTGKSQDLLLPDDAQLSPSVAAHMPWKLQRALAAVEHGQHYGQVKAQRVSSASPNGP
eukprot:jgi/Chrzof1/6849/Cz02g00260.t1